MKAHEVENWERTRSRGILRFLLSVGVGRSGVVFLAVVGGLDYFTRYGVGYDSALLASHFAGWLPGAIVAGVAFGSCYWLIMEKQYKEANKLE